MDTEEDKSALKKCKTCETKADCNGFFCYTCMNEYSDFLFQLFVKHKLSNVGVSDAVS